MSRTRLNDLLELIGMAAIIGSLIFVGFQIRQDQKIAVADTYGTVSDSALQLAELINGNADLWRRGLDGDELSLAEQIEFESIAASVESWFIMQWYRSKNLGASNAETDLRDFSIALHTHTGLRRYFEAKSNRIIYTDTSFGVPVELTDWTGGIIEHLDYLTDKAVPVPENKSYVFWN
jgi:hypothetical protein